MAIISKRGAVKRGVNKRSDRSLSPPPLPSTSVKGVAPTKRQKQDLDKLLRQTGRGRQSTSDDDFDVPPSQKKAAAIPPQKAPNPLPHTAASPLKKAAAATVLQSAAKPAVNPLPHTAASPLKKAAAATVLQSAAKPAVCQPPAGMFPTAVIKMVHKAMQGLNGKKQLQATTQQAALPPPTLPKTWSEFGAGQDVSPDSTAAAAAATAGHSTAQETLADEEEDATAQQTLADEEGDEEHYDVHNASARAAAAEQKPTNDDDVHIDLGNADGSTMASWWDTFMMGSRGGGFLARSLFSAAAQDSVLGSNKWVGPTSVKQNKQMLSDMRSKFLEWTEAPATNEWVRSKLFNIIVTNPKTYVMLKVILEFSLESRVSSNNSSYLKLVNR
jgi:hypothetical protein